MQSRAATRRINAASDRSPGKTRDADDMPFDSIRKAAPDDLAAIEAIVEQAYRPYVASIGVEPAPLHDDYAGLIAAGRVTVIDSDGAVLALIVLVPEVDAMLLDNVAVAPAAQGRGLGRRLLDFAEDAARQAGYGIIRLYTNVAMIENIAIYERAGYVETRRGEEKGLQRVYMAKVLGPP